MAEPQFNSKTRQALFIELAARPDGVTAQQVFDEAVKRGDTVKRGQTIAKSGQTGNVATPQLHFELRKGSTPVDPTQYLAGL